MSIGKNAIKRVENNGYSKVKTNAPDMENSSVIACPSEEVMEKLIAPIEEKAVAKKTATKSCVKKTTAKKSFVQKETEEKETKSGFERVSFGEALPYYLL